MLLTTSLLSNTVNPFDPKTILLARHAQHVVLIHFPLALFITAVLFDLVARLSRRQALADAAYYNFSVAALSTLPAIATGILAWQLQFSGQMLRGLMLEHLALACLSSALIALSWALQVLARRRKESLPGYTLAVEFTAMMAVTITGHLGGFLSGVNRIA